MPAGSDPLAAALLSEVARFQAWAEACPRTSGEWECDYDDWPALHRAVLAFLPSKPFPEWSPAETAAVLHAIARDNEIELLARTLRDDHPALLLPLTRAALTSGEGDARWQLADQLGRVDLPGHEAEALLLGLVHDEHEYVRRRALGSLARIASPHTEAEALRLWATDDPDQQWARMMALWALHRVRSLHLDRLLTEAAASPLPHLAAYAQRVRRGEVDP